MIEKQTSKIARLAIVGLVVAAFVVFLAGAVSWAIKTGFLKKGVGSSATAEERAAPVASGDGTQVFGVPEQAGPVALEVPNIPPAPAIRVVVHDAALLKTTVQQNPWLKQVLTQPLGRGFVGSWAGFLGTRGEDMSADFKGTVVDLLLEKVLAQPFEVVWFAGRREAGVPAVIIQEPNGAAKGAFEALDAMASRGTFTLERCIERGAVSDETRKHVRDLTEVTVKRWLLADHAVYAALGDDRLVVGRKPSVVQQGMCAVLEKPAPQPGVAVEVGFESDTLGREAQVFLASLGLDGTRLLFGAENNTLVPRGIAAKIASPGRLATGKLGGDFLRTIPEEAPVVLALQVALPKSLDAAALAAFFKGESQGPTATRQVALVWYPGGTNQSKPDIAVLWSEKADKAALSEIFASDLQVADKPICNNLVLAATSEIREKLELSCNGKLPSLNHGAGNVVAGWQGNTSVVLGLNLGKLLVNLTRDAWDQENGKTPLPSEMQEATRQLEALPFFGLSGAVQGAALLPGGFRS
jgi:hypothetical protein